MSTLQRALLRGLKTLNSISAPHIIVTTILSSCLCYNFITLDSQLVNSINTAIRTPTAYNHCPLFISSLYIESAIPERLDDQGLQSFLRAPLNYYALNDFKLLPISFIQASDANRYVERIRAEIESSGCARLMLSTFKLGNANGIFPPGTLVINGLMQYNYRLIQLSGHDLMPYFVMIR